MSPLFHLVFALTTAQTLYALVICFATLQQPPFVIPVAWTNQTLVYLFISGTLSAYRLRYPTQKEKTLNKPQLFYLTTLTTWLLAFAGLAWLRLTAY